MSKQYRLWVEHYQKETCLEQPTYSVYTPTLVLAGDDDPIVPLINARILAARIPDARLRVVDCCHLFLLTRAKVLTANICSRGDACEDPFCPGPAAITPCL